MGGEIALHVGLEIALDLGHENTFGLDCGRELGEGDHRCMGLHVARCDFELFFYWLKAV